jgi:hypothetical protein
MSPNYSECVFHFSVTKEVAGDDEYGRLCQQMNLHIRVRKHLNR